jgi:hypothetical protein
MAYTVDQVRQIAVNLQNFWSLRKTELTKYWDFYYGDFQRAYLPRYPGETGEEYAERMQSATIENHCAKTCDVIVGYLYGHPNAKSRVSIRIVDRDGKIIDRLQELLKYNVWVHNDIDSLRLDWGLMASVCGFAMVYKEFVDSRTMEPFPPRTPSKTKEKYGTVRYEIFDSTDTMPLPKVRPLGNNQDLVYSRILGAIVRFYSQDAYYGASYYDKLLQRRYSHSDYFELYDDAKYYRGKIVPEGSAQTMDITEDKNPYGKISTPFTLFRNFGDPMYLEGESDLSQMIDPQTSLNQMNNDDLTVISHHSLPILKATEGAKFPQPFVRKVNSILEIERGNIEYLTWDNVLEASSKKEEDVRRNMTVTSGVGQLSRGNASDIGQVRSGAGLKTLFQADINEIGLKVPLFKEAEKKLVRSTIDMLEQEMGVRHTEYFVEVEFPEDFVGVDELVRAQTEQIETEIGKTTIRELVKKRHPEVTSEEEIDDIVNRVMAEKKRIAKTEALPKPQNSTDKSTEQQT